MPTTRTNVLSSWGIGLVALILLAFGLPAAGARLLSLPGDAVKSDLLENRAVSDEALTHLDASRRRVAGWFPKSDLFEDLALVSLTRAQRAKGEEAKLLSQESEYWEKRALAASPADPEGWFRLAYLYYAADRGPSQRSAEAWTESLFVGRYEPSLMLDRLQMGVMENAYLTPEARAYFPVLIRGSAVFDADGLARLAKQGAFTSLVEDALQSDEAALAYFRKKIQD